MRKFAYFWGIAGVLALLLSAIFRLSARILEMLSYSLSPLQWLVLIGFALYMAYAEGYKGFHLNFSPRVIARAGYFSQPQQQTSFHQIIFAPLLCMGFIYSTTRRRIIAISVTSAIVVLVIIVSRMPQPWRGIIDTGVVLGLLLGVISLVYFWIQSLTPGWQSPVSADFPE